MLFFAQGKIQTTPATDWLYLEIGFGLQIDRGSGRRPAGQRVVHPFLYTAFSGKKLKDDTYYQEYLYPFLTEERALSSFRKCLTAFL